MTLCWPGPLFAWSPSSPNPKPIYPPYHPRDLHPTRICRSLCCQRRAGGCGGPLPVRPAFLKHYEGSRLWAAATLCCYLNFCSNAPVCTDIVGTSAHLHFELGLGAALPLHTVFLMRVKWREWRAYCHFCSLKVMHVTV